MSDKSGTSAQVISLPKGGGALSGIGETFTPDLHTGTGNFTIPITLPSGRNGFQPELNLVYSTGNGNGPFGLGWGLSIPGVSRKTSKGVPRYDHARDVFILSGAEDLVPVSTSSSKTTYRPRTEGLFAHIEHHDNAANDYWRVWSKDGLQSIYGTPAMAGNDPAVVTDPADQTRVFAWKLTETRDPSGNRIVYTYERDTAAEGLHHWDQLYLTQIRYVDYDTDDFLVSVSFDYEELPEHYEDGVPAGRRIYPFSDFRAGFEIRTRRRCTRIVVRTHTDEERLVQTYELVYLDQRTDLENLEQRLPLNGVSLLCQVRVVGHDGQHTETLPPLEFGYSQFEPGQRDFFPVAGAALPARSLAAPEVELADLFGNGLPDILEMNGTVRYWRNLGNGRFDLPRPMREAPGGLTLADPRVQLMDADGDGRIDLMVSQNGLSGYFPLQFNGEWDRRSFRRYPQAPSFSLADPEVKLVDLDGDGVTDAIRSGARLELFYNDPDEGWSGTRRVERRALPEFPNVNFSDPRLRWGDMSGDGLQDLVLIHDGNVEYWPSLGYGNWSRRISMHHSPRFPYGYNPRQILVGDVDGDGLADIVYVDQRKLTLWINQSGHGWSDPIVIDGTPPVTDMDAVRLVDLLGTGVSGVLWSRETRSTSAPPMYFHDFTGGVKPYVLEAMDNHLGAVTRVQYRPSTHYFLEDQKSLETRWQTSLPFPVQVVACVEVIDLLSGGKLTTEYRYHHGYWDGAEREFRGFGMVEQLDTEAFTSYHAAGLHGKEDGFEHIEPIHFSPPTLSKTWFHQGPVGDEFGAWAEMDYRSEYWSGDPTLLERPPEMQALLKALPRRAKRDALRALRGSILRSELYALDSSPRQERPYTVTESLFGVCEVVTDNARHQLRCRPQPGDTPGVWDEAQPPRIFFPHALAQRTTQWERGNDPLTQFSFTEEYDRYGQPRKQTQIACPRGWHHLQDVPGQPYLATHSVTEYAQRADAQVFIVDRIAGATTYEIENDGTQSLLQLKALADAGLHLKRIAQSLNFYDGEPFTGLPYSEIGERGALMRTETLVLDEPVLAAAYGSDLPPYLSPDGTPAWTEAYPQSFRDSLPINTAADPTRPGLVITPVGYAYTSGGPTNPNAAGYFVASVRNAYDARGLLTATRDPFGRETVIVTDEYDWLPERVTDPAGLTTTAVYDYRVLQPQQVTDLNGNQSAFTFSPLGLLTDTWVKGNPAKVEGDRVRPGARMEYDFLAFQNSSPVDRQPAWVRTIRQIHHDTETDVPEPARSETIETVEYSDGFGRLLQTRTQAEDVLFGDPVFGNGVLPADQNDVAGTLAAVVGRKRAAGDPPNVVVSGWQTYNNKGWVVEKYEPFFGQGWNYLSRAEAQALSAGAGPDLFGQKATMFFDPRGQVIHTLNPDGSEQRVVYGIPTALTDINVFEPTPWEAYTYDGNDNAGRTHPDESESYKRHWNTPASIEIDALGRTIKAVERNGHNHQSDWYTTRSSYDIRGNLLTVTDALGRLAFRHVYDLANNPRRIDSIDAGMRRMVLDATGHEIERRDSKGALILQAHDILNRPLRLWARDGTGEPMTLRERIEYGDGSRPDQPASARQAHQQANRLGQPYRHDDEAGRLTFTAYDFKGNLLEKTRQVIGDDAILSVFTPPPPGWKVEAFRVDWELPAADSQLDASEYTTSSTFDALSRVKTLHYPQDVDGQRRVLQPVYNSAGALEQVSLYENETELNNGQGDTYVEHIAYNARGQRILIAYGNGIMTRHAYDTQTFRLARLRSEAFTVPGAATYQPGGALLQDYRYEYDLSGNILKIAERVPGCGVMGTQLGPDALDRDFTYAPLYRLLSATGRECKNIAAPRPWTDDPRCGFNAGNHGPPNQDNAPHLTRQYAERYTYDAAGSMLTLRHTNSGNSWTRHFGMGGLAPQQWNQAWQAHLNVPGGWPNPPGNQLTHVGDNAPTASQTHYFDDNGNLTAETTSRHFDWDHGDQMKAFFNQANNSEPSVHAQYLYDGSGQRVKKLVRKKGGYEITVYIDGIFEYHLWQEGSSNGQNNRLHVMDDQSRISLVRVGPLHPDDTGPAVQYHLVDHLGSSNLVINGTGNWINREEYTPYGETSFGSFARKRYRFTGKERDEESGLNYHGARYYAPWLGRWCSADPASYIDLINIYSYARNSPVRFIDKRGTQASESFEDTERMRKDLLHNVERLKKQGQEMLGAFESRVKAAQNLINYEYEFGKGQLSPAALEAQKQHAILSRKMGKLRSQLRLLDKQIGALKSVNIKRTGLNKLSRTRRAFLLITSVVVGMTTSGDSPAGKVRPIPIGLEAGEHESRRREGKELGERTSKSTPRGGSPPKPPEATSGGLQGVQKVSGEAGRKGVKGTTKLIGKSLPFVGAVITLLTSDAQWPERITRSIAGEIGVGPLDLETGYDTAVGIGEASENQPPPTSVHYPADQGFY